MASCGSRCGPREGYLPTYVLFWLSTYDLSLIREQPRTSSSTYGLDRRAGTLTSDTANGVKCKQRIWAHLFLALFLVLNFSVSKMLPNNTL